MTHPITPPTELVAQWLEQFYGPAIRLGTLAPGEASLHVAVTAAQWGADQELEACEEWVEANFGQLPAHNLHQFRRPKPPSLKEQALLELGDIYNDEKIDGHAYRTIFQALEALPND